MSFEMTVRVANSSGALEKLLRGIESQERARPDWIHIQGDCKLGSFSAEDLETLITRLHRSVLRGFRARLRSH